MGRWSDHYRSWKSYNLTDILIIKYEDLVNNPKNSFLKILEYLKSKNNGEIDLAKLDKALNETNFNNLKKKENNFGFKEKSINSPFFRKGIIGDWKNSMKKDLKIKIENAFSEEMKELDIYNLILSNFEILRQKTLNIYRINLLMNYKLAFVLDLHWPYLQEIYYCML